VPGLTATHACAHADADAAATVVVRVVIPGHV